MDSIISQLITRVIEIGSETGHPCTDTGASEVVPIEVHVQNTGIDDTSSNRIKSLPDLADDQWDLCAPVRGRIADRRFRYGRAETIGRRAQMEDEILIKCNFGGRADEHLFAVFDGHGGNCCSRFVSNNFCSVLADCIKKSSAPRMDPAGLLRDTFRELEHMCREHQIPHGSCAIVTYFVGGAVFTACLGDSRAVLGSEGKCAKLMAQVHKPSDIDEQTRIKQLGGFVTPNGRVNGVLGVSRALGDLECQPFISAEPCIEKYELQADDKFVVLACDGVWDIFDDQGCIDLLMDIPNPEKAAAVLRDSSYLKGSKDNISSIVIRIFP